jgi:ribokinase
MTGRPARRQSETTSKPSLTVVGSINLDLVARVERLPRPGETLTDATLDRIAGGKGANQAVAAARLGAEVRMIGCVGRDAFAPEALAGLRAAGVDLDVREVETATGIAVILVAPDGENQIVVVPGANAHVAEFWLDGAVLCQLEIPDAAIEDARAQADWLCVNAAPARPVTVDPDLLVVNRYELEAVGDRRGLVAQTLGEEGAVLLDDGNEVARARPPRVDRIDGTAAGDAFTACSSSPCSRGAIATRRSGGRVRPAPLQHPASARNRRCPPARR